MAGLSPRVPPALYGLGALGALVLSLEGIARAGIVSRWILPPPSEVASAIWQLHSSGILGSALLTTMKAVALCAACVIAFGLIAGYLLYRYPLAGRAYTSLLGSLFSVPLILFFPIFLVIDRKSVV